MRHLLPIVLVLVGLLLAAGRLPAATREPAPEDPLAQVTRLHRQVVQLYRQGQYAPALAVARQAHDLAVRHLGEAHPEVATALDNLGLLYKTTGAYATAEPLLQQALEIRHRTDAASPEVVTSLNNLAGLYRAMGRYQAAEQHYQRALDIVRAAAGEDNEYFAGALSNLASLYKAMGHYAAAEPLYHQALRIWRARMGVHHPDVAIIVHNLADLYVQLGQYSSAEPLYQQALALTRAALGSDHPQYARSLQNLAALYEAMGRYDQAEVHYKQALTVLRTAFPEPHPEVASSLHNLAGLYKAMGDYSQAEALYRQALAMWRLALGEDHGRAALSLHSLGDLAYTQGHLAAAEPLYQQALALQQRGLGPQHVEVASTLNSLAVLDRARGNYAAAATRYQQALDIWRAALGESSPDVALGLHNLGALAQATGDYAAAATHYQQALAIRRAVLGEHHPDIATSLYSLASVYAATGRLQDALGALQQAATIEAQTLGQVFAISSERRRMAYLQSIRSHFDALVSFVWRYGGAFPSAPRAGFDLVLRRKALGAEALAVQRDTVLGGPYPALQHRVREWAALRRQIGRKRLDGPGPEGVQEHARVLASWESRREQVEADLARHIPEMNLARQLQTVDRAAVARALPAAAVLIEFVRYAAYDFDAVPQRGDALWQAARYGAFVMPAEAPDAVEFVDLGEAGPIERLLAAFRAALSQGERQLHIASAPSEAPPEQPGAGAALRAAVFDPLVPALRGRTRLFLAPDGDLTRLPFEVLPGSDGHRLIEAYRLSYLSTGRDVLRLAVPTAVPATPALVIADPDFDLRESAASSDGETHVFARLPGTRLEGERVAAMLGVQPWLERDALKARLMATRAPRLVHLATHGFFLPAASADAPRGSAGAETGRATAGAPRLLGPHLRHPLWRSGLALAGANAWLAGETLPDAAGNGILHAEDVATLALLGTELVVLSACDTGLGEVHAGEGVFGLRRAFVLAGARTLVMSLWKVPDQPTQELMVELYRRLLAGQGRADALRGAQLALQAKYPPPWYWGAFILQGDPAPLPRSD